MEKDRIFFGKMGITNTQANYIANLAKENYQSVETALNKLCFYSTTLGLIGSSERSMLLSARPLLIKLDSAAAVAANAQQLPPYWLFSSVTYP